MILLSVSCTDSDLLTVLFVRCGTFVLLLSEILPVPERGFAHTFVSLRTGRPPSARPPSTSALREVNLFIRCVAVSI